MDNETLLESISQHMDQLSSFQGWMLITAISAIYMIVKRRDELEVVGIKLTKEDTSIALSVKDSRTGLITWASVIALIISLAVIGMIDEGRKAKNRTT